MPERPLPILSKHAALALGTVDYNYQNAAWQLPYSEILDGRKVPSFASALANVDGPANTTFPIDYSIKLKSIPTYSAGDLLTGRIPPAALAGKDVVIGSASAILNDVFFIPGYGRGYGVYVQALGAETLKKGNPIDVGWLPAFLLAIGASLLAANRSRSRERGVIMIVAIGAMLVVPAFLEARLIFAGFPEVRM